MLAFVPGEFKSFEENMDALFKSQLSQHTFIVKAVQNSLLQEVLEFGRMSQTQSSQAFLKDTILGGMGYPS